MGEIFLKAVNMSITAGWIALAVMVLRLAFKKTPKWISCLLWGLVAIRLICPFSIESALSLLPSGETIPAQNIYSTDTQIADNTYYFKIDSGFNTVDKIVNPYITDITPQAMRSNTEILGYIWLIGIAIMLIYTIASFIRIKLRIREAVPIKENIYICDRVPSPFILGVIKPKIILPSTLEENDCEYVIAHEKAHIKRFDHLWKPFGFLLLSIHWFNPLMWVAYVLLCKDIELACDERVIKDMDSDLKKDYATALLNCSVPRRIISACPLAFGEVGVKGRIKSALSYKKPAFWVIIVALVLTIVLSFGFLTNPAGVTIPQIGASNDDFGNYTSIFDEISVLEALSDGETYYIEHSNSTNREILNQITNALNRIKISKNPISLSRSDDRDKTHTLTVNGGHKLHFGKNFDKLWIENGVKPTLSYKVLNPSKTKAVFEMMKDNQILYSNLELMEMVKQIADNKDVGLSSNPYDYINANSEIYKKLLSGGHNTVSCFVNELRIAEEYGLDKYIMAAVCSEITGIGSKKQNDSGEILWSTAEEWLKLYDTTMREQANNEFADKTPETQLKKIELIPKSIVYDDGRFSFYQAVELAPDYMFSEFSQLYKRGKDEKNWTLLGDVTEITLNETNFDSRLTQNFWKVKFSASGIRGENLRAWELKVESKEIKDLKELYIILEQPNGRYYLCYGYYGLEGETDPKTPDNSFIRWIYEVDAEALKYNPNFNAKVLEIYDGSILVEPFEGENERKSADKIYVGTKNLSEGVLSKLKVGSEIRVVYNGVIQESYPASLNYVFAVYFLDEIE